MNRHRWRSGAAVAAGVLAAFVAVGPVRADTTTDSANESTIRAKGLPVTAAGFAGPAGRDCDPTAAEDVWYLGLHTAQAAATDARLAEDAAVVVSFAVPGKLEPHVEKLAVDSAGTASARTPAGWTLIGATVRVRTGPTPSPSSDQPTPGTTNNGATPDPTGAPGPGTTETPAGAAEHGPPVELVLLATCSGRTPERALLPAAPPVPGKARTAPIPVPSATVEPSPVPVLTARAAAPVTRLPTTGSDITGMFVLGLALVVTGFLLLIVRRQRVKPAPRPTPSDWY